MLLDIDSFYKELGQRIKSERIRRNISQKVLGDHLELTRASVINLEKGRHRPSLYQLIQIANFFQIDYTSLIPYQVQKPKRKMTDLSKNLDNDNIVTDQEKIGRSGRTAINNFLATLKNSRP
jgi:transcriptional regulator with XRE-family HTH domain